MAAAPAPGTGGTGKDQDGGKERAQFENDRRHGNAGGADRPPIYSPHDDGERNGYISRNTPGGFVAPAPNMPAHMTPRLTKKGTPNPHNVHK